MADNYLESKMEEYRSKPPRRTQHLTPSGRKPGFALLPYDIRTAIIITDAITAVVEAIATELRGTGCRVAICSKAPEATRAAQKLSCIHVRETNEATSVLGEIELTISATPDRIMLEQGRSTNVLQRTSECGENEFARRAANLIIYLTLPDSQGRFSTTFDI